MQAASTDVEALKVCIKPARSETTPPPTRSRATCPSSSLSTLRSPFYCAPGKVFRCKRLAEAGTERGRAVKRHTTRESISNHGTRPRPRHCQRHRKWPSTSELQMPSCLPNMALAKPKMVSLPGTTLPCPDKEGELHGSVIGTGEWLKNQGRSTQAPSSQSMLQTSGKVPGSLCRHLWGSSAGTPASFPVQKANTVRAAVLTNKPNGHRLLLSLAASQRLWLCSLSPFFPFFSCLLSPRKEYLKPIHPAKPHARFSVSPQGHFQVRVTAKHHHNYVSISLTNLRRALQKKAIRCSQEKRCKWHGKMLSEWNPTSIYPFPSWILTGFQGKT